MPCRVFRVAVVDSCLCRPRCCCSLWLLCTAVIAAQEAARREAYLQLDLPESAVLWVEDAAGCARAHAVLSTSDVLGLDVEWKPSHLAGVTSPAAVLQAS